MLDILSMTSKGLSLPTASSWGWPQFRHFFRRMKLWKPQGQIHCSPHILNLLFRMEKLDLGAIDLGHLGWLDLLCRPKAGWSSRWPESKPKQPSVFAYYYSFEWTHQNPSSRANLTTGYSKTTLADYLVIEKKGQKCLTNAVSHPLFVFNFYANFLLIFSNSLILANSLWFQRLTQPVLYGLHNPQLRFLILNLFLMPLTFDSHCL